MKKFYVFAAVAIAALASCTKSEVVYNQGQQEIGFRQFTGAMTMRLAGYSVPDARLRSSLRRMQRYTARYSTLSQRYGKSVERRNLQPYQQSKVLSPPIRNANARTSRLRVCYCRFARVNPLWIRRIRRL